MALPFSKPKFDRNFNPSERAYAWGYKQVEIDRDTLDGWLGWHTESNLRSRVKKLKRRVDGMNAIDIGAVVLGVSVFLTALFVDYNIIHEFWTRALSNEFGEVPPSLATTVASKSLQVLFGTLAIHYFITHIGHGGRVIFSLTVFLAAAIMIVGIGMLWANSALPPGAQIFGFETNSSAESVNEFMKGLGVKHSASVPQPAEVKLLKKYQLVVWLFSLSVIFLVVASIGALSLHAANSAFHSLQGGRIDQHNKGMRGHHNLRDDLVHARTDLALFSGEGARHGITLFGGQRTETRPPTPISVERFRELKLGEFKTLYTDGLIDASVDAVERKRLLNILRESIASVRSEGGSNGQVEQRTAEVYRLDAAE